jgi:hypothetical protein
MSKDSAAAPMHGIVQRPKPSCRCAASTGIHDSGDSDGTPQKPWGLTFGSGQLDDYGYWQRPCSKCARWHEEQDGVPFGSYWPFE